MDDLKECWRCQIISTEPTCFVCGGPLEAEPKGFIHNPHTWRLYGTMPVSLPTSRGITIRVPPPGVVAPYEF